MKMKLHESLGELLTQIAREHIQDYNFDKGLKSLTESGLPKDVALGVITGDLVLSVENNMFNVKENKTDKNRFDIVEFLHSKIEEIKKFGTNAIKTNIRLNRGQFLSLGLNINLPKKVKRDFCKTGDIKIIDDYINECKENFIEEEPMIRLRMGRKTLNKYLDDLKKTLKLTKDFERHYSLFTNEYRKRYDIYPDKILIQILEMLIDCNNQQEVDEIKQIMDNEIAIKEELKNGIKPVDLNKEVRTAGWIAPNGTYYGLNGDTANFLHITIADALKEAGIIPESDCEPDQYLEKEGWIRQHGNHILFAGYYYKDKIKTVTDKQKEAIVLIGQKYFDGELRMGMFEERVSAAKVDMMDRLMLKLFFSN